jgi:hypothetical protein
VRIELTQRGLGATLVLKTRRATRPNPPPHC